MRAQHTRGFRQLEWFHTYDSSCQQARILHQLKPHTHTMLLTSPWLVHSSLIQVSETNPRAELLPRALGRGHLCSLPLLQSACNTSELQRVKNVAMLPGGSKGVAFCPRAAAPGWEATTAMTGEALALSPCSRQGWECLLHSPTPYTSTWTPRGTTFESRQSVK